MQDVMNQIFRFLQIEGGSKSLISKMGNYSIKRKGNKIMTTQQEENLINLLDGYVEKGGHHLNVNVFNRETLLDAQAHPEKYPQLTVRSLDMQLTSSN